MVTEIYRLNGHNYNLKVSYHIYMMLLSNILCGCIKADITLEVDCGFPNSSGSHTVIVTIKVLIWIHFSPSLFSCRRENVCMWCH